MAPLSRMRIAAKPQKRTVYRRSHILLCGSRPCAFTPSKLNDGTIMGGISRDCQTAWNRRFTTAPISAPVFDSAQYVHGSGASRTRLQSMLSWMSKALISKEQLGRNQVPIYVVVLVLGVCRELTSLLASPNLRSSEAHRCSFQGREWVSASS